MVLWLWRLEDTVDFRRIEYHCVLNDDMTYISNLFAKGLALNWLDFEICFPKASETITETKEMFMNSRRINDDVHLDQTSFSPKTAYSNHFWTNENPHIVVQKNYQR